MNRHDLNVAARVHGRVVYQMAADLAIDAGASDWEVLGLKLHAALGAHPRTTYVEVWQSCQVGVGEFGDIVVRFWRGRTSKSGRTEWLFSVTSGRWQSWEFPAEGGFNWVTLATPVDELKAACEAACGFSR